MKGDKNTSESIEKVSFLRPIEFLNNIDKASINQICAIIMVAVILIFSAFGFAMLSLAFSFRGYIYIQTSYNIELTVDNRDVVTNVKYYGSDANETFKNVKMVGLTSASAIETILFFEAESGNFSEKRLTSLVFVSVTNKNEKYTISDLNRYISSIRKYLDGRKISAYVNTDCFTEEEITKAKEYKITAERYRLMRKTAELLGEYDIRQLLSLTFNEAVQTYNKLYINRYLTV